MNQSQQSLETINTILAIIIGMITVITWMFMSIPHRHPSPSNVVLEVTEIAISAIGETSEVLITPTPLSPVEQSTQPNINSTANSKMTNLERSQEAPIPKGFLDDFSDQNISTAKWTGLIDSQGVIQIANDQLQFNTANLISSEPRYYSVSPRITEQPYAIANITQITYKQQVNTLPAPTRSELGVKLLCSGGGWLTLSINANETSLRLRYQTLEGNDQAIFLEAPFPIETMNAISINRVNQEWSFSANNAPPTTISDFDCSIAENVQFFADVQNCQDDVVSGSFDDVFLSGH